MIQTTCFYSFAKSTWLEALKVEFLGRSPQEAKLVKKAGTVAPSLKQKIGGA